MELGISTSCLYPLPTEDSLITLGEMGVKTCEIFLNSTSETTPDYASYLNKIKDSYGIKIVSVHPFSSFAETHMLFGNYERRFLDMLEFYKRHFETVSVLGADITVIHGAKSYCKIGNEAYFERFSKLIEAGKEFGVRVCQENVFDHYSQDPEFLKDMRNALGDDFKMVFDVKQSVRAGFSPCEMAEEFKHSIVHVHLSDNSNQCDCLPPSKGCFDFRRLFSILDSADYKGCGVIELYRQNYETTDELAESLTYLRNL